MQPSAVYSKSSHLVTSIISQFIIRTWNWAETLLQFIDNKTREKEKIIMRKCIKTYISINLNNSILCAVLKWHLVHAKKLEKIIKHIKASSCRKYDNSVKIESKCCRYDFKHDWLTVLDQRIPPRLVPNWTFAFLRWKHIHKFGR